MLNTFAKFLLVSTSLSPLLGAVAVNKLARGESPLNWCPWLAVALLLVFLCWGLLSYSKKNAQCQIYRIKEFERNDKEVLAFLVTYLLPFLSTEKLGFTGDWLTGTYVLLIIFMVIAHADAFHFNPVMGMLGFHFYSVKSEDGVSHLLISETKLCRTGVDIQTVQLDNSIYLRIGENDA